MAINGTSEINCVTSIGYGNISSINFEDEYKKGGQTLSCGKTYRVKLKLINDCTEPSETSKDITYLCVDGVSIDYEDYVNCLGEGAVFQIPTGTIQNCSPCSFSWTPAQYLLNPNSATPTVNGATNTLAIKQTYRVTAVNSAGCVDEDEVNIINLSGSFFTAKSVTSFCDIELLASIASTKPIKKGVLSVKFINITTGLVLPGTAVGSDTTSTNWEFTSGLVERSTFASGFWVAELEFTGSSTNCQPKRANIGELNSSMIYTGGFPVFFSNAFTPNGDTINDTWGAIVIDNPNGINAYWGKIRIYTRWGEKVFEKEITGTATTPFSTFDLRWDGTIDGGSIAPEDEYLYIYELKNCDNSIEEVECNGCSPAPPPSTWCNCTEWSGSVTLIR